MRYIVVIIYYLRRPHLLLVLNRAKPWFPLSWHFQSPPISILKMSHPESNINKTHENKETSKILMKSNCWDFYVLKLIQMTTHASCVTVPLAGVEQLLRFNKC